VSKTVDPIGYGYLYNTWYGNGVAGISLTGSGRHGRGMAHKLNDSKRTIAVDFDGVIAEYDGYKGPGVLGEPRIDVVEAMRELRSEGWKIVIHTTRGEHEIADYLARHAIPFDEINRNSDYKTSGPKPVADLYWDDRAVSYSGDARKDLGTIRTFKTWSGRE
jgi:hypothetical protein